MTFNIDTILDEHSLVFEEAFQKVRAGRSLAEISGDYGEFKKEINVGTIGFIHYVVEYEKRRSD